MTDPQPTVDQYIDLLATLWLYMNWRSVTRQLTTEQKNLLADAVDAAHADPVAERWWSEWPTCRICQTPVEPGMLGDWLDLRGNREQAIEINWAGVGLTPPHVHEVTS